MSKVSLIFTVLITSVLSTAVIFHCYVTILPGGYYELRGCFSTFIANFMEACVLVRKKTTLFCFMFVNLKSIFDIWQALEMIAISVVFLTHFFVTK